MVKIKGSALLGRLAYLKAKATAEQAEEVRKRLTADLQRDLENGVLANTWYPFPHYLELNRVLDQVLGRGDLSLIPEIGRFSATAALNGVYRIFFKLGSPEFIIQRAPLVWKAYHTSGKVTVEMLEKGELKKGRMRISEFETPSREHCLSLLGWVRGMLEMAGATEVEVHEEKCATRGAGACEFIATWR